MAETLAANLVELMVVQLVVHLVERKAGSLVDNLGVQLVVLLARK